MQFSIIIPAYNAELILPALYSSLENQVEQDFEVIVVDDCSVDGTSSVPHSSRIRVVTQALNRGPAHCRNIGARQAKGEILVFTDSDCRVDPQWLAVLRGIFDRQETEAVMGRLVLDDSNWLGNSISALGFPAGGSLGFDKIWEVDSNGYTNSLSTCNCAVRQDIFHRVGGFDESFPYAGGEDSFFAYQLRQQGFRIKYCPEAVVYHAARDSLKGFFRWQFRRGVSSYIFARKIVARKGFVSQRFRAIINVIRYHLIDWKIPVILLLLVTSYGCQLAGFIHARHGDHGN